MALNDDWLSGEKDATNQPAQQWHEALSAASSPGLDVLVHVDGPLVTFCDRAVSPAMASKRSKNTGTAHGVSCWPFDPGCPDKPLSAPASLSSLPPANAVYLPTLMAFNFSVRLREGDLRKKRLELGFHSNVVPSVRGVHDLDHNVAQVYGLLSLGDLHQVLQFGSHTHFETAIWQFGIHFELGPKWLRKHNDGKYVRVN